MRADSVARQRGSQPVSFVFSAVFRMACVLLSQWAMKVFAITRLFAITKPGIAALALSVAALWTCLGVEASVRHQADRNTEASLRTLIHLRQLLPNRGVTTPTRQPTPRPVAARPLTS